MEENNYSYIDDKEKDLGEGRPQYQVQQKKKGKLTWLKVLLIVLLVIVVLFIGLKSCNQKLADSILSGFFGESSSNGLVDLDFNYDYIATIYINGEIDENGTGTYYHSYILNVIDELEEDSHNKGIILWVNTPGGSVFASDELYLKLNEYKEKTSRPIYSSFQSQATSGGYYISANADKIVCNRNCWTGSIGVTLGTMYDVSELLDKLGVKVNIITAGTNKAMGSSLIEMTKEQREILQSLVDDAYEQFVGIVASGRKLDIDYVKELADGRIYTANQALENGLIDAIGTYEDTVNLLKEYLGDDSIKVEDFITYDQMPSLTSLLGDAESKESEYSEIEKLLALNNKFEVSYKSNIRK